MTAKFPQQWLVYRLSALGDVVLTTGVLDYLHSRFGWTFVVVTRTAWVSVFHGHKAVRHVIGLEKHELKMPKMLGVFGNIIKNHKGFGLLDLHGTLRSHILSLMWRLHALAHGTMPKVYRYPKFTSLRRRFLTEENAQRKAKYAVKLLQYNVPQRYVMAVTSTPPDRQELLPTITLTHEERTRAQEFLRVTGLGASAEAKLETKTDAQRPLVALHPYATHAHKAWLPQYWQALADALTAAKIPYFVVGQGHSVIKNPRADFSNSTSLRECCALIAEADILITGDSGPMHLAGAVQTPVIALFGPTCEEWGFFPAGEKDKVLEIKGLSCRPCSLHGSKACTHHSACMNDITPDMVMEEVESLLKK